MQTIREQIEPHLRAAGIKPTAEAVGIHRVMLQDWIAGRRDLHGDRIEALCRHLGLELVIRRPRKRRQ